MFLSVPIRAAAAIGVFALSATAFADDKADMLAVADAALERISAEDSAGFAALMIPETMIYVGDTFEGQDRVRVRDYEDTRNRVLEADLIERGWDPTVLVSGTIGVVWYPYDIYVDGKWSHCGIDVFNMIRTAAGWRIASLQYNVLQPPECSAHPDGPPAEIAERQ